MEFRFSEEFEYEILDLRESVSHVLLSSRTEKIFIGSLKKEIQVLKEVPNLGINFDERIGRKLFKNHILRLFIIKKEYLVFYTVVGEEIFVLHLVNVQTNYLNRLDHLFNKFSKNFNQGLD